MSGLLFRVRRPIHRSAIQEKNNVPVLVTTYNDCRMVQTVRLNYIKVFLKTARKNQSHLI